MMENGKDFDLMTDQGLISHHLAYLAKKTDEAIDKEEPMKSCLPPQPICKVLLKPKDDTGIVYS